MAAERRAGQATAKAADEGVDELVTTILTASRVLVGVSARSLAEVEDTVTLSQFRTLVVLRGHGQTRLNRLAERLGVGPSTALRAVDRLIAAGLVVRRENEVDRREVVIGLTPHGTDLVDTVTARRRAAIKDIVSAMPAQKSRALVDALDAFSQAADEPVAVADPATLLGW
jgi:DNA-binding MarR family transcriptional regulator